jgi:Holliday junction resolvase RusA-like endonuclease
VIAFELEGEPIGWQRTGIRVITPRHGKPFPSIYTPAATRAYEKALAMTAKVAMRGRKPLDGPLRLVVTAFMPIPRSWSAKKRDAALAGTIRPTVKPDWDNTGKGASDALKGIVWADDTQVVDGRVIKLYDERPRLRVEITPIEVFEDAEREISV